MFFLVEMKLTDSIQEIKGIGEKTAAAMKRLQIETVSDLIGYYPRSYETYEAPISVKASAKRDFASVLGVLMSQPTVRYVKKFQIVNTVVRDPEGASLRLSWFNMPYLAKTLKPGSAYIFRGKIKGSGGVRAMEQPQIFRPEEYEKLMRTLQPVYPLGRGVTKKMLQEAVQKVFAEGVFPEESLDADLMEAYGLMPVEEAVRRIHFPADKDQLIPARKRLVFEEFYRFIVGVRRMKETIQAEPNEYMIQERREVDSFIAALPYSLTNAQKKVLLEIQGDLTGDSVMNRLVQGDVGSGKTIIAFIAMYQVALNGFQSVLMAPTEVLAHQHFETFKALSEKYSLGLTITLLTGSMTAKEKKAAYDLISSHRTDMIIGTHAVIQDKAHYDQLALVITDEQHRFGVNQRKLLSEKGRSPHVLVMSATPIPRTLGMIIYGDLDISVMDELPANRLPIKNALVDIEYRPKAYKFMEKQIREGHQVYVICPMVEESENSEGEDVVSYTKQLRMALPSDICTEYLHGKMKNAEKEALMEDFAANRIQVLVSTTVIEVGIDVPNATVILIENAERFGLAQLHQLRGRVGRGKAQSYCILVDTTMSEESEKRLKVLAGSNDGFFIASEDLKMRGPGDFFGMRQSGDLAFRLGDIYTDAEILKQAEEAAERTISEENQRVQAIL